MAFLVEVFAKASRLVRVRDFPVVEFTKLKLVVFALRVARYLAVSTVSAVDQVRFHLRLLGPVVLWRVSYTLLLAGLVKEGSTSGACRSRKAS